MTVQTDSELFHQTIREGLQALQIPDVFPPHLFTLERYFLLFKKWQDKRKLSAAMVDSELVEKHFIDSLSLLRRFEISGKVMDIGPGAGFPSMPIKIVRPQIELSLVESSRRKVSFLKILELTLDLKGLHIIHKRIEDFSGAGFDWVLSRAAIIPARLIPLAPPLLNAGGRLLIMAGSMDVSELEPLILREHLHLGRIDQFQLPFSKTNRVIVEVLRAP
jgi:16S rRNA (guanine527-N7)-methyltransferase